MATLETNRLYKLKFGNDGRVWYSGYEGRNAAEALAKIHPDIKPSDPLFEATSEPIYRSGMDLCLNACSSKSENAVFEIVVRGTDPEVVDQLKHAIARAIGGIALDCEDEACDYGHELNKTVEKYELSIEGM